MENNESLFNEIKSAAENAETKNFPGMEKVWNRVEEKLDNKEAKKAVWRWKKIAVAASILLITTLGYQFFKNNPNDIKPNEVVTINDSVKKASQTSEAIVATDSINPAIKDDAEQILQKQLTEYAKVAIAKNSDNVKGELYPNPSSLTVSPNQYWYSTTQTASDDLAVESKEEDDNQVELFINKDAKVNTTQKEEPLVVINNKAAKKSIKELEFNDVDSLVVLKEPLYIINGVEFTEKEVFGPNPTSPYTPLNKQEIETLSILQDEKAIEIYGEKGTKGVVIITTKNGKPVIVSKKTK